MARARYVVPALKAAEAVAEPAITRGHCVNRAEYRACSTLARVGHRGLGTYRDQLACRARAAMPKEGPGALAYYRAVTYPNHQRRYTRYVRINGQPGFGSRFD